LTGFLAFLPLHAAGLYGEQEALGSKLSDFVVSSYTPTLTALQNGSSPRAVQKHKMLTIALPLESGLPCTRQELDVIEKNIGDFSVTRLLESEATVENVVQAMEECSWVHFACHGVQNISDPTESALVLAGNSKLTLSRITQLSLPHAELAFLSACQTATGAEDLAEEAVYLAAGMLLAGYRGVIATMWSIKDNDAPKIAEDVYAHLFKEFQPDATEAAYALHIAVQKLCGDPKNKKSFFDWVPFIHIGA
jgi:CHAT domain-containing protein